MQTGRLVALVLVIGFGLSSPGAVAGEAARSAVNFRASPAATFLAEGEAVLAPMAHVLFCATNGGCESSSGPAVVRLDDAARRQLAAVNRQVNRAIRPVVDSARQPLADRWSVAPDAGDCEDYALTKQHRLASAGWPAGALRLAVGRTATGEGHAVLVVRTTEGDLVLDNRSDRLLTLAQADIRIVKVQSGADPRRWRAPLVAG